MRLRLIRRLAVRLWQQPASEMSPKRRKLALAVAALLVGGASQVHAQFPPNTGAQVPNTPPGYLVPFLTTGSTTPRSDVDRWSNLINVKDWGATGLGSSSPDTAAVTAAFNYMLSAGGTFGNANPAPGLRALYFPTPYISYYCPGLILSWDIPGVCIFGDAICSTIDGASIYAGGQRWQMKDLRLIDSRGIQTGSIGIRIGGTNGVESGDRSFASNIWIRDKDVGLQLAGDLNSLLTSGGAFNNFVNIYIESCNTGFQSLRGSGAHIVNMECITCLVKGIDQACGNEVKLVNCRVLDSGTTGVHVHGTTNTTIIEPYYIGLTSTVTRHSRIIPILSVADNGSGFARFTTSAISTISSIADAGAIFTRGATGVSAACSFAFSSSSTGGQVTQIAAGGVNLLSAPVPWNSTPGQTATDVVNAINANSGSTGYTSNAPIGTGRVWVYAPVSSGASADGTSFVVTIVAPIVIAIQNWVSVITSTPHGYLVGDDVELACTTVAYTGIAEVMSVTSSTVYVVEQAFTGTDTGTSWYPNRLQSNLINLFISGTGLYDPPYANGATSNVTACTGTTFDTNIPYTATATGQVAMPGWDLLVDAQDINTRTQDMFFTGGNINYTLIKSAYRIDFVGTRLKQQVWIDNRMLPALQPNRILVEAGSRIIGANQNLDVRIGGALKGWGWIGYRDDSGSNIAGNGYLTFTVPNKNGGTTNGSATVLNQIKVTEIGATFPHGFALDTFGLPVANSARVTANATGLKARFTFTGEAGIGGDFYSTGPGGAINIFPGGNLALQLQADASAVNFLDLVGRVTTQPIELLATGSDTNVSGRLTTKGTGCWRADDPFGIPTYTVATLPTPPAVPGFALAAVTDATLTAIVGLGLAPVGGGGNKVMVYWDTTQWLIL